MTELGQIDRACALFEKALLAAPDNLRAARLLEEVRTGIYQTKRARRRKMVLVSLAVCAALLIAGYGVYNALAARAYLDMRNKNLELLEQRLFPEALNAVHGFVRAYPSSLLLLDVPKYRKALYRLEQALVPPPPPPAPPPVEVVPDSAAGLQ
jgi:tetratricopeptide (TPR) repeat protein